MAKTSIMTRFIALPRPVCGAAIALLALGAVAAPAAGPVLLPVPAALAASPEVPGRSVKVISAGAEANRRSGRSSAVLQAKVERSAVWDDRLFARPLVILDEAATAPKIARLPRTAETLAGRPRLSPDRRGFTLKVLDRPVWVSRVTVTRQRMEIVFTTRF